MSTIGAVNNLRQRSPRFPSYGLETAVERVKRLYEKDRKAATPREVAAKHLGYTGLNGAATQMIGALTQYGLVEDAGQGKIRVTDRGEGIVLPKHESERSTLLEEAFRHPKVFSELINEFGLESMPSDDTLKAHLRRDRGFTPAAANDCVKSLRQGLEFVRSYEAEEIFDSGAQQESSQSAASANMTKTALTPGIGSPISSDTRRRTSDGERIEAKLSNRTRAEVSLYGPLGEKERAKLLLWLDSVVKPWAEYLLDEGEEEEDEKRER